MPPKRRGKSNEDGIQETDSGTPETYVIMASLSEMLKIQERMYKSLFESALNTVTARVDELVRTVTELKTSLEFTQQDVDHLKPKVDLKWKLATSKYP